MAALSEIEKLKARFDENPEGRYFAPLADAYRKTGRLDEAIELIQQGLSRHPDYLSAHIVLGRCYLGKKDDPAAKQTFEGVLALDSENIIALKSLAEIGERTGDTIAARRWLDQLLQVDPTNMDAESDLKRLGGPLAEGEDTAAGEAETAPMPAIDIEPTSVEPPLEPVAAASDDLGLETMAHIPDDVLIVADEQTDWAHLEHTGMPRERLSSAIAFMGAEGPQSIPMDLPLELEPPATAELEPGFEPTSAGAVPVPESSVDLPLIMPEDVTPAEELARPSLKQVATVSPEPLPAAGGAEPAAPLLTETMAELYLKQGFRAEAADVYRRLLAKQPGDAHLTARLAAVAAPAPSFSATALGQEPLGSWLRRVVRPDAGWQHGQHARRCPATFSGSARGSGAARCLVRRVLWSRPCAHRPSHRRRAGRPARAAARRRRSELLQHLAPRPQALVHIAVLNGPNLNLLGVREPERYGTTTLAQIETMVRGRARELGVELSWMQTNHEGALVDAVQALQGVSDGALVNAAAYSHTSLALRDALLAVRVPFVEVHLTNMFAREEQRRRSLIADLAEGVIAGFGAQSYLLGLEALIARLARG